MNASEVSALFLGHINYCGTSRTHYIMYKKSQIKNQMSAQSKTRAQTGKRARHENRNSLFSADTEKDHLSLHIPQLNLTRAWAVICE